MPRRVRGALFATAALAALAAVTACGGGGGQSSLPGASGSAVATFTLTIPSNATSSSTQRSAKFISPATQSVTIGIAAAGSTTASGAVTTANLTPSSPNCTAATAAAPLTCTVSVDAPAGNDTFVVTLYAGLNGSGSVLASSTVTAAVSATQPTTVPVTLGGVVASIAVTVVNGNNMVPGGFPTTLPVTVVAKDASGATIVGPANYANPITLTNADTSGITALSTTTVTSPSTVVTLAYAPTDANGGVLDLPGLPLGADTIGASASGVAASAVIAGTFQYIADRFFGLGHTRTLSGDATVVQTPYDALGNPQAPTIYSYTVTDALTNHTGLTFNGVNVNDTHHVITYTQTSPVTAVAPETQARDDYRAVTGTATGAILYRYGTQYVDVNSGAASSPITGYLSGTTTEVDTFPSPGAWEEDALPHVAGTIWSDTNVPHTDVYTGAEAATFTLLATGAWTFNETSPNTIAQNQAVAGTATNVVNGTSETIALPSGGMIPVTKQVGLAAPTNLTPTDWYPGGGVLSPPLYTSNFSLTQGAVSGSCGVPAAVGGQAYIVTQVNTQLDVAAFQNGQQTWTDYYIPNGVGFVCEIYTETRSAYSYTTGIITNQTNITDIIGVQSVSALAAHRSQ